MNPQDNAITIEQLDTITQVQFRDRNILDEAIITQISCELEELVQTQTTPKLLINFQNVQHLTSALLGSLIAVKNRIMEKGGQLRLTNIDPQLREVFKITKLDKLFKIYTDADDAIKSFT